MSVLGPVQGMILPWRQAVYAYAVGIVFAFGFYFMLGHRQDWWGWVILVVYVVVAEGIFIIWRRSKAKT